MARIARSIAAAALAALALGGCSSEDEEQPSSPAWRQVQPMRLARGFGTATVLTDGSVLAAGGNRATDGSSWVVGGSERFDPATTTWSNAGNLSVPRGYHAAVLLADGRVLVVGGWGAEDAELRSAELYDAGVVSWTRTAGDLVEARANPSATRLASGKVLVAGGAGGGGMVSAELYDPATGQFTSTGSMHVGRFGHAAVLLPSGRVLVAGGCTDAGCVGGTASVEVYDPAAGTWAQKASLPGARIGLSLTVLPSGEVLAAAGCTGDSTCGDEMRSAYLWSESNDAWRPTGQLNHGRGIHFAALLMTGKVFVVAGDNISGFPEPSELYDPASGEWTSSAQPWTFHGASPLGALLADGRVLLAGGLHSEEHALDSTREAELYEP